MAITGPVVVRAAEGTQWQASHREAEIGAVSTRPSTLFGFADKEAGISLRALRIVPLSVISIRPAISTPLTKCDIF
jgi:hypothetical protein